MVRTNTFLKHAVEFKAFANIVNNHNKLLKTDVQTPEAFFQFSVEMLALHPKYFQHFLVVTYPTRLYSLIDVKNAFPEVNIIKDIHSLYIDNSLLVSVINASLLKKQFYFKKGTLQALEPPKTGHDKIQSLVEFQNTGQKFPDYAFMYIFNEKTKLWRYYDQKTSTDIHAISVTQGHVIGVGVAEIETKKYEEIIEYLITHQYKHYQKLEITVADFIHDLLNKTDLSWSARNLILQEFYLNNLHKYPKLNPTLVFQHEAFSNSYSSKGTLKHLETFINSDVVSSKGHTENAIARIIHQQGPKATENYLKESGHNKNIVATLKDLLNESINNLKNIH